MGLRTFPRNFFSACVKFGGNPCRDFETAWPNLSEPVHNTVTMYARRAMSFFCTFECSYSSALHLILLKLHISAHLMESFPTVYHLCICTKIEISIPLGAHAEKTIDRKMLDRRNLLVLRPVLLKFAYFHSANQQLSNAVMACGAVIKKNCRSL